ncbi:MULTISPECIES: TonB-dependent receptor [unclassified Brevundimonas]|uniref:TonB-dependent receptor n=1 Tax=unclassified Brevundimonas TaxID=2622653 RepID=UPI0006FFDDB2|nr:MULTISPECIES: TonB-dependent receptor [unclassified Brevundimonas]KQY92159.1 TonB-dependent receptor [Brevundimonas sp. Root1423]KRA28687.1 TonB-dependent receptor [Brevundimonas sp. Root608]
MRTPITRRARLLAGAAIGAVGFMAVAGSAAAQEPVQDPDATEIDEVIVTGIRASIQNSIAAKRNETSIVEVVTAEDIGKLPDVSIAESLGRLPGLALQRLDGRGQNISIRGLGPDFTTALLNGREQVTTSDNRGVEFDQYPSELLGSVVVYKTPDAALIGQGLAGTADLRVIRPLEYGRQAIAANLRYELNDIGALNAGSDDSGWRYSVSYIDQFADDTIGVVLGYAHIESPYQSERFNAWGYPEVTGGGPRVIGGSKPYVMSANLERNGYIGVLELKPNDRVHMTFDAFYSEFDNTQILRGIELPLFWSAAQLQPGFTVEDGLVVAGTYTGVKGVVRNDVNERESTLTSLGWNGEFRLNDVWSLNADVNYSSVERTDQILETYAGTGRGPVGATDTIGFRTSDDITRFSAGLDYGDFNLIRLTSPQGWGGDVIPGGQDGYLNSPTVNDELTGARFSLEGDVDWSFISGVEVGVYASKREKEFINDQFYLGVPGGASAVVPTAFRLDPTSLAYLGIPRMISYDALGLVRSGFYNMIRNPNADVRAGNWFVEERVTTPFVKFDINTTVGPFPLTGNFGIQGQYTEQSSDGFAARQIGTGVSESIAISGGDDYWEILPSANLIFELAESRFLRLAAARTLSRARMDQMRASRTFSYNASRDDPAAPGANLPAYDPLNPPFTGGGGNPQLRPWIANVFDISFEQYFGRSAYFSVAAYYKDLETYVYDRTTPFDYTGFPPATGVYRQGTYTQPENGEGGEIYGIELAVSTPFDFISPWLEGFGGQLSVSQTESKIQPDLGNPAEPIPGLSETVANLTLYYEKDGVQARVSNRYRSEFVGEVAGFGNGRTFRRVAAENIVDAQIGYEFQAGPLEGLSALFQVNNLTDEPFYTYEGGDERRIIDYQSYGRTFLFGLNYRY